MNLLRYWWMLTFKGIVFILTGIYCLVDPAVSVTFLVTFLGIIMIVSGLISTAGALIVRKDQERMNWWLIEGFFDLILGIVITTNPMITAKVFLVIIALWVMFLGGLQIISALRMRNRTKNWIWIFTGGVLTFFFGVLIINNPFGGAKALIVLVGTFLIFLGTFVLIRSFQLRKLENIHEEP